MSALSPGDKVVCIKDCHDHLNPGYGDEIVPDVGGVYTVRECVAHPGDNRPCILLKEVVNRTRGYRPGGIISVIMEPSFLASYFRPVEYKAMGIFRQIAKDVTEGKKVPADV